MEFQVFDSVKWLKTCQEQASKANIFHLLSSLGFTGTSACSKPLKSQTHVYEVEQYQTFQEDPYQYSILSEYIAFSTEMVQQKIYHV